MMQHLKKLVLIPAILAALFMMTGSCGWYGHQGRGSHGYHQSGSKHRNPGKGKKKGHPGSHDNRR